MAKTKDTSACRDRGVGYEGIHGVGCGCDDPEDTAPYIQEEN